MRLIVSGLFFNIQGELLLARRLQDGKYTTPGGKVDDTDVTIYQALCRETLEECGLKIDKATCIGYVEPNSKLVMIFKVPLYRGHPQNLEPDKHGPWGWYYPEELRGQMTLGLEMMLDNRMLKN